MPVDDDGAPDTRRRRKSMVAILTCWPASVLTQKLQRLRKKDGRRRN